MGSRNWQEKMSLTLTHKKSDAETVVKRWDKWLLFPFEKFEVVGMNDPLKVSSFMSDALTTYKNVYWIY